MATSTSQKSPCATCSKVTGAFTCKGCQKDFCKRHVVEHQQELTKQLDELTLEHDQFRQILNEKTQQPHKYALMKQIDEWEEQSISRIRQAACDARKQIQDLLGQHATKLTKAFNELAQNLRKARDNDDFYETDLTQWMEKLNILKKDLVHPPSINIQQEDNNIISFIPQIVRLMSSKELFERSLGDIRIEGNGQVIVKNQSNDYATVRGSGEYTSGQHRFRLKIEMHGSNKWLFIGIISKNIPLQERSYKSQSSYGWDGSDGVFSTGVRRSGFNGYRGDTEKNDVVELFVDCDQRMIRLKNKRTRSIHTLAVDTSRGVTVHVHELRSNERKNWLKVLFERTELFEQFFLNELN
jgi:hypothetical protein